METPLQVELSLKTEMDFNLDKFLAEQDAIYAMPDEDVNAYAQRRANEPSRRMNWTDRSYEMVPQIAERDHHVPPGNLHSHAQSQVSSAGKEDAENETRRLEPEQSWRPQNVSTEEDLPDRSGPPSDIPGLVPASKHQEKVPDVPNTSSSVMVPGTSPRSPESNPDPPLSQWSPYLEKRKSTQESDSYSKKRRLLSGDASADVMHQSIYPPLSPILDFSPQGERLSRPITVKQGPQLPLVPVVDTAVDKPPKKKSFRPQAIPEIGQASASESLIEDASFSEIPGLKTATQNPETKNRAVTSEPSKLMLQLKERVARHAPSKVLPKTVKLGKAGTAPVSESAGESSIIYVPSSPSSREGTPPPAKKARKQPDSSTVDKGKQRAKVAVTAAKGKKEKPKPVTPFEYAEQLKTKGLAGKTQRRVSSAPFLEGYNVFYTGGDRTYASETTRNRMEILVRLGCNLFSRFDPEAVTHIITEGSGGATLQALGVKRMRDIPEHIPTVKWSWVTLGMGSSHMPKEDLDEKLRNHLFNHGAFSDRLTAGMNTVIPSSKKGKNKSKSMNEEDISHISDFTQDKTRNSDPRNARSRSVHSSPKEIPPILPSPSISPPPRRPMGEASSSRVTLDKDPLAEFYERAKVSLAEDKGFLSAPSDAEEVLPAGEDPEPKRKKSRWTCDVKDKEIATCPNQDIIDKLSELMELHKAKPGQEDHWRAFAYSKAIRALKHHPSRIKTYEEARSIRGVGDKTAKKIAEILETGDLRRIGYERTEDVQVAQIFQGIYGVGRTTAYKWYSAGCRTLEDLRNGVGGVKLSSVQEIGLQFYDDINERMPRNEAEAIFHLIKPIALSIDPSLFIEIMGSFRRGKATCGDIDILITRPLDDGKTHIGVLPRLLEALHSAGILTEDLALPDDLYDLEATYRGLCRLPDVPNSKRRRIDFLTVPWKARGAALLYYTGDDIFNRAMRYKAGAMGYSLNQRGLHAGIVRDPQDRRVKINDGHVVASETEEEIFRILGVPWQEPHERVRG